MVLPSSPAVLSLFLSQPISIFSSTSRSQTPSETPRLSHFICIYTHTHTHIYIYIYNMCLYTHTQREKLNFLREKRKENYGLVFKAILKREKEERERASVKSG
jgi:hypothetical protein